MSLRSSIEHENGELRHAGMDSRHPDSQGCLQRNPCQPGLQQSNFGGLQKFPTMLIIHLMKRHLHRQSAPSLLSPATGEMQRGSIDFSLWLCRVHRFAANRKILVEQEKEAPMRGAKNMLSWL